MSKRGPLLAGLACAAPALGGTVDYWANPGRDLDIAKIAAVRAAWIRAAEASDISGLIALATDDIVVVHGNGKAAIDIDALRADLTHDFEYLMLSRETHPPRSSFMTNGRLSFAKWTKW